MLFLSCALFESGTEEEYDFEEIARVRKILAEKKWIIHAGGLIQDENGTEYSYTNSLDALNQCYALGNTVSEIDFRITSDNCLVCTHEWNMMSKNGVKMPDTKMTKAEFLQCQTHGGFKSMWLGDLVEFLKKHNDFYFVTDIKDDNIDGCRIIRDFCPEWKDHFIIQIYHASEYDEIRALGFKNIIYTLYATTEKERDVQTLINFAKKHELLGFTYWYYWTPTYFAPFKNANISQYLHTVNNTTERNSYLQQGISAIYTDVVKN